MINATDTDSAGQPYLSGAISADFWTDAAEYQMSVENVLVARWLTMTVTARLKTRR